MALKIKYTNDIEFMNTMIAIYGNSGVGKTYFCGTAKDLSKVLVLSSEHGTLTLKSKKIAFMEIDSWADLMNALKLIAREDCPFQIICFDSISDFLEMDFREKSTEIDPKTKALKYPDQRKVYLEVGEDMKDIFRKLRGLSKDIVCIFKQGRVADQFNVTEFAPAVPGAKASQDIPYFFDAVLALRMVKYSDNTNERQLLCQPDGEYIAKDRSGTLANIERPDLGYILDKMKGNTTENQQPIRIGTAEAPSFIETSDAEEEAFDGE
jgi:hypothetical protein